MIGIRIVMAVTLERDGHPSGERRGARVFGPAFGHRFLDLTYGYAVMTPMMARIIYGLRMISTLGHDDETETVTPDRWIIVPMVLMPPPPEPIRLNPFRVQTNTIPD